MAVSGGIARTTTGLGDLLRAAMPVPDPMVSEEQYDRYHHIDLDQAPVEDLERELVALQLLNYFDGGELFHQLREERIRELLARRRAT